jgi:hypothetical protein
MFTELERPVADAEKKRLLDSLPRVPSYGRTWGPYYLIHLVGMALAWPSIAWWSGSRMEASWFVAIYGLAYATFMGVVSRDDWRSMRWAAANRAGLERQLSVASLVTVQRVEAQKVVEIECDEINVLLYDLEDGRFFVAED